MIELSVRHLLVHGSIVTLIGVLMGLPYWGAIVYGAHAETTRSWRVAHAFLCVDGMLILVAGLIVPRLALGDIAIRVLAAAFIGSGYAFVAAFVAGALTGFRGLTPRPHGWRTLLFLAHLLGALGVLTGLFLMLFGTMRGLR